MNPPLLGLSPSENPMRRKSTGRLRAYAVEAAPRTSRKATRFKCRNCGQKVLVDRTLWRPAITCPTCQEIVLAPRRGRLWLEAVGAILIFLVGLGVGHQTFRQHPDATAATTIVKEEGIAAKATKAPTRIMPRWFHQNDGTEP